MSITANSSVVISLRSGLAVAIEEYGTPAGQPVLFFHGWPSAAAQGMLLHEAAAELGIRIIAISRPGIGASAPQSGRTLSDWPPLVREIAVTLDLPRFRVLGVSGGGPYALVCAWGLPDLIEAAAVACGAPPLADLDSARGLNLAYRAMLGTYRQFPGAMRGMFWLLHPMARVSLPAQMLVMLRGLLCAPDRTALENPAISKMCYEGFRAAWGDYRHGVFEDAEHYTKPWGFALEEVRVPVRIWHGTEDRNFSHTLVEYAKCIPGCNVHIVPGEGHFSLPIRHAREILTDLMATGA